MLYSTENNNHDFSKCHVFYIIDYFFINCYIVYFFNWIFRKKSFVWCIIFYLKNTPRVMKLSRYYVWKRIIRDNIVRIAVLWLKKYKWKSNNCFIIVFKIVNKNRFIYSRFSFPQIHYKIYFDFYSTMYIIF